MYSISSSQMVHPDTVHTTVRVIRYDAHGRSRQGVASGHLGDRAGVGTALPIVLHANNNFRLEKLSPGRWTEEQSRKNLEMVSKLVNPGDAETSLLTKHPLAPEAGGHAYHSGGRQFAYKDDPDWNILVQFVNGAK